jgi:hypothetical protein
VLPQVALKRRRKGHRRDEQLVLLGGVVHRLADDGQDQGGEVDFEVAKGEPRVAEKTEIRRSRDYASRMQTPQRVRVSQGPDDAIRVIAAAVIRDGDRILVWHDHDPATGEVVAVPLAGGIEFGETGEEAIRRELKEEIGSGPKSVRYLGLFEDIFEWTTSGVSPPLSRRGPRGSAGSCCPTHLRRRTSSSRRQRR